MSDKVCVGRLKKEYRDLQREPVANIRAAPREANILEWHYVIEGQKGSLYEGGWYHGIVIFPKEYPYKPPSIQMLTRNGRFKQSTRLCLSMSDFHPETWNPLWSVGTVLMGLLSFMLEDVPTYGHVVTSDAYKKKAAQESLAFNCQNKIFCELFPELVELHEKQKLELIAKGGSAGGAGALGTTSGGTAGSLSVKGKGDGEAASWATVLGVLVAIIAVTWAIISLAV